MKSKQRNRFVAVSVAVALVLAACGSDDNGGSTGGGGGDTPSENTSDSGGTPTPTPTVPDTDTSIVRDTESVRQSGGSVVMGLEADAVGMRPWADACGEPCLNIQMTMFEQLMRQRADGTYGPWLATAADPNEDFTVWTVTLREGVTFHNGVDFNAQTIVDMYPIQEAGTSGSAAIASSLVTGVEATGDYEVTYTLSRSNSAFPASLAGVLGRVFEPGAAADEDAFNTNPVGTGAFVMDKRDIDNETVVVRNADYWMSDDQGNQLPYLDSVVFRPIPDEGTRLDALLSGTVSMMHSLRQGTVRDARAQSDRIDVYEFQGNNTGGGMYNTAEVPFDDVRVRQGLNRLNNQEAVIDALGGSGISVTATQWFSPDDPFYTEEAAAAWPMFDFEAGRALLQEYVDDPNRSDGKAPGEKIDVTLSCPPDPTLIAAMQVLEQVWSGTDLVNVSLTQFDQATHISNAVADLHHAQCWRWSSNQDPSLDINPVVAPPEESVSNFPNFFNEDSYDLAQRAIQTDDFEERRELYKQIMINFAEDAIFWYSGYTATMVGADPSVQGINGWLLPDGTLGNGFPNSFVTYNEIWINN